MKLGRLLFACCAVAAFLAGCGDPSSSGSPSYQTSNTIPRATPTPIAPPSAKTDSEPVAKVAPLDDVPVTPPAENTKLSDSEVHARLKAKIAGEWPNDYSEQKFIYNQQVADYDAMKAVPESDLKAKIQSEWPLDYSEQKFIYKEQIEAYEYMKKIPESPLKAKAESDWPLDFTEQKFVYQQNVKDKSDLDSAN